MIDRIRALYPHLSLGVYALTPGGDVTVEVFAPDGTRFTHKAQTAAACFTAIFGPLPDDAPAQEEPAQHGPSDLVDPFG